MKNKQLVQILIPLGTAIFFVGFILLFSDFSRICELKAYDLKMRMTARLKPRDKAIAARIKVINVTDSTIKKMGWPKQKNHARLIDILSQHKAAMIAYDWIFHEPQQELVRAVRDSGRMFWPVLFDLKLGGRYRKEEYPQDMVNLLQKFSVGKERSAPTLWHTTTAILSHASITRNAEGIGHISARNEEGGSLSSSVYRKIALVVDFSGRPFPSLALQMICRYLHVPLKKIRITPGQTVVLPQGVFPDTGQVKDIHIPINERGEMWIYFPGRWEENYFEPFWFENVLDKHKDPSRWPEYDRKFNDNICFVGNASGKIKDTHVIPMEDSFPGVGIQAAALFTILSENFIHFSGTGTHVLILLVLALIMGIISHYTPPLKASMFHLLLVVGYVLLDVFLFSRNLLNFPVVFPAITILIGGVVSLVYHFAWEQMEKERALRKYALIELEFQRKERLIQQLTAEQETTKQQTAEKLQELTRLKREREELFDRKKKLEMAFRDLVPE